MKRVTFGTNQERHVMTGSLGLEDSGTANSWTLAALNCSIG